MHAVIAFFAALPGRAFDVAAYAWGHPAVAAVAAMAGLTASVALIINVRTWRKGA